MNFSTKKKNKKALFLILQEHKTETFDLSLFMTDNNLAN